MGCIEAGFFRLQLRSVGFGTEASQKPEPSDSSPGEVKGFVMETVDIKTSQPSSSSAPLRGIGLVIVVLFMIWMGFRGKSSYKIVLNVKKTLSEWGLGDSVS